MKKYIFIGFFFVISSMVSAQVMLPAYQGVFSKKTLSTDGASNGLNFDGVDDRVLSTNDVKFKISVGSLEGWIKTGDAGTSYRAAFGKSLAYCLYLYNNELTIYDWGAAVNRPTGITLNDNSWHHIAMTFNSGVTNGTLIYIDGVLKLTTTMTISSQAFPFSIGSNSFDPAFQFYTGSVDDVRVWNVIRTQTEIQDNMNTELLGSETGLVAYYPLNQGVAAGDNTAIATVTNKSANALNGTLTNFTKTGTSSNFVNGKVQTPLIDDGLMLSLDANNTNSYSGSGSTWKDVSGNNRNGILPAGAIYTTVSEIKSFNFAGSYVAIDLPKNPSMTYFVWAKSSVACSTYMVLFGTGTVTAPADPQLFFRGCYNCWNTQDANGNNFLFSPGVVANYTAHGTNWHNYTVVNDAVTNTAKLYYDGVFVGAAVYKNSKVANFIIGAAVNGGVPWQGGIANVKAYNKSLTNSEILNVYISTKGVFGY
jgi:hypothetical protein